MTYAEARARLDELPRFEVKPGLERVLRLLDAIGHPERTYPAVHVAGTNGKGSVVAMLDAILRAARFRVGRFTSPSVVDFRDRVTIDGVWLDERGWAIGVERLASALQADDRPAQFEAITALALDAFSRPPVDLAVVEVGLGGRYDATNVVQSRLTLLTNVSLDHTSILGSTVEEIAWEKAGIAKPGVPLLTGVLDPAAERVVEDVCADVGAPRLPREGLDVRIDERLPTSTRFRVDADGFPDRLEVRLVGDVQKENLCLVLHAVQVLRQEGLSVPNEAVEKGLRDVRWPGRFEILRDGRTTVLDGAHNVAAAQALAGEIERMVPDRTKRRLLLGVLADKDVEGIVLALVGLFDEVVVAASSSPRATPPAELAARVRRLGVRATWYDSVEDALRGSWSHGMPDEVWFITGSLTVVSDARSWVMEGQG